MNRRLATFVTLAGGVAAAASIGMSVAQADTYEYTLGPDQSFYTQLSTTPFSNVESGDSYITVKDLTTGVSTEYGSYGYGNEVLNPFNGSVESWNLTTDYSNAFVPDGTQIDVMEFGNGFANQFVDAAATTAGAMNTITDTLITPFGDYTLFSF
jgi:hypothetical protein